MTPQEKSIPYGFCHCGCGVEVKNCYANTDNRTGKTKGEPCAFLPGHQFKSSTKERWKRYTENTVKELGGKKICSFCGFLKSISEFYPSKHGLYRVAGRCIECSKKENKRWIEDNPEYVGSKNKRTYQKVKTAVFDHYGHACNCCGETEPMFLSIDHVNNDGGGRYRDERGYAMYRGIIMQGFPDKYQVLCWNCNVGKQRNGGTCPHKKVVL